MTAVANQRTMLANISTPKGGEILTTLPAPTDPPSNDVWEAKDFKPVAAQLHLTRAATAVRRTVHYCTSTGTNGSFVEDIFPIYVPPVAQPANSAAKQPAAGSDAVATMDDYWAKASDQARSTAKWIATLL